jgi:CBS domain-containing protein
MATTSTSLYTLTAGDLMNRDVVVLPQEMPLREAARRLLGRQVGGAPVVDSWGKCVGVLSALDFVRLAVGRADVTHPTAPPLPITCQFQVKHTNAEGREVIVCTLPPGACPLQVQQLGPDRTEIMVCSQPHCVLTDWQVVEVEKLPTDEVRQFMTADPVTVPADTPIEELARKMLDAHIHRLIVVNEGQRPVGIVSTTNILAAVARGEGG